MKKIRCRSLSVLPLLFLVSFSAAAQDLSEDQRIERCQNNKARLTELEGQLRIVNADLNQAWTKQEIEDARDQMVFLNKLTANWGTTKDDQPRVLRIAGQFNFAYDKCANSVDDYSCTVDLRDLVASKITKAMALQNKRPELLNKKNEFEKQIAEHRNNLTALGCDGSAPKTSTTGSLHLTGPEMIRKNEKGTWHEYAFTATTAIIKGWGDPPDKKTITWNFAGLPASLSPKEEVTITVTGSLDINPGGDLMPPASAGISFTGFDVVSQQGAYISAKDKRDGKYVLRVPANATSLMIAIWCDYGGSTFAIYRYEKKK